MESLVKVLFTDLGKQVLEYDSCSYEFQVVDTRLREQTDNTIEQSDRLQGRLSKDNLEAKIIDFESLIKKLDQLKSKITTSIDLNKVKQVCDVSCDTLTRACFYGFGAVAATISAFNDITEDLLEEGQTPTWLKVYRSASCILILPFIYGVEENLKKKETLRADRVELMGDIDDRLYSAEVFLNFLVHRKEALEVKSGAQSPETDERLADLLEGAPLFRGFKDADEHEKGLISFARARISQTPDSPPGLRLKTALQRALKGEGKLEPDNLKMDFRQSALLLSRSFRRKGNLPGASWPRLSSLSQAGVCHPTVGYSQTPQLVRDAHRGSSDEQGMINISLDD